MGRRYRKRSSASLIVSDTAYIGSKLPWWGALIFGVISFVLFYYLIPAWFEAHLVSQSQNAFHPILEAIFGRRIHWSRWIGVACGLIGVFFGVRNYFFLNHAGYHERGIVGFFAKILGRDLS